MHVAEMIHVHDPRGAADIFRHPSRFAEMRKRRSLKRGFPANSSEPGNGLNVAGHCEFFAQDDKSDGRDARLAVDDTALVDGQSFLVRGTSHFGSCF